MLPTRERTSTRCKLTKYDPHPDQSAWREIARQRSHWNSNVNLCRVLVPPTSRNDFLANIATPFWRRDECKRDKLRRKIILQKTLPKMKKKMTMLSSRRQQHGMTIILPTTMTTTKSLAVAGCERLRILAKPRPLLHSSFGRFETWSLLPKLLRKSLSLRMVYWRYSSDCMDMKQKASFSQTDCRSSRFRGLTKNSQKR